MVLLLEVERGIGLATSEMVETSPLSYVAQARGSYIKRGIRKRMAPDTAE